MVYEWVWRNEVGRDDDECRRDKGGTKREEEEIGILHNHRINSSRFDLIGHQFTYFFAHFSFHTTRFDGAFFCHVAYFRVGVDEGVGLNEDQFYFEFSAAG